MEGTVDVVHQGLVRMYLGQSIEPAKYDHYLWGALHVAQHCITSIGTLALPILGMVLWRTKNSKRTVRNTYEVGEEFYNAGLLHKLSLFLPMSRCLISVVFALVFLNVSYKDCLCIGLLKVSFTLLVFVLVFLKVSYKDSLCIGLLQVSCVGCLWLLGLPKVVLYGLYMSRSF